jgi:hypothetical protein
MEERKAKAEADSLREWKQEKQRQKRVPCGNGRKKSKRRSRFPAGMTARKAKATTAGKGRVARPMGCAAEWGV